MTGHVKNYSRVASKCLVLLLGLLIAFSDSGVAQAASNEGPIHVDNDGTRLIAPNSSLGNSFPSAGRYWDYVVSYDDYTDVTSSDVLVYSPVQRPTITIIGSDLCVNNSQNMRAGDVPYSPAMPSGRRANDYRLYTFDPRNPGTPQYGSGISVAYDAGVWNYSAAATCRASTVTLIPAAYSIRDDGTGMYIYRINALANMVSGGKFANSFHVVGPPGSIVTQSAVPAFSGFGMQASYPFPDAPTPNDPTPPDPHRVYSDLFIPFGPDCTLTTPTATKSIIITDADNDNQYSVQPQPFRIAVQAFTRSTGVYRGYVPLTWRDVGAGYATDVSGGARTVWEPHGSNQTGVLFDFTVQQGVVYRLVIARVYYNNTLEFRLPYDGAHFYIPCTQPTVVRPVASLPPSAEVGGTVTATASAQRVGAAATNATGNYLRRVWYDTDRDGAWDAGEVAPAWYNGGNPNWTGTFSVPSGLSSAAFPTRSGPVDRAGRLCTMLQFTNPPGANTTYGTPNPTPPSCTEIGKRPKMHVEGGDVMAGGTFRNGSGVCPILNPAPIGVRGSSVLTIGAAQYSSYADYGIISLGQITTFGANTSPPQQPLANMASYGNTTNLGYFYSAGRGTPATGNPTQARCINDPFAVFSSRGPVFTAATLGAGVNLATALNATSYAGIMYTGTTTLRIGALPKIPAGKKIYIYAPNANVEIVSNIEYEDGPYASIDQLPQVVVMSGGGSTSGKITVLGNVTRMDGIYATRGDFVTCNVAPRANTCTSPLNVNGAVVANRVIPFRTAGAQAPNYGDMAETFRLRPDVLLNQFNSPGGNATVRTIDQREVPPRF